MRGLINCLEHKYFCFWGLMVIATTEHFQGHLKGGGGGQIHNLRALQGHLKGGLRLTFQGHLKSKNCRAYGGVNNIRALWGHFTAFQGHAGAFQGPATSSQLFIGPFQSVLEPPHSRFQGLLRNFMGHFWPPHINVLGHFRATSNLLLGLFRAGHLRSKFQGILGPPQSCFYGILMNFIWFLGAATSAQHFRVFQGHLRAIFKPF